MFKWAESPTSVGDGFSWWQDAMGISRRWILFLFLFLFGWPGANPTASEIPA